MKTRRITIHEMRELYPNQYLFLTDFLDDGIDIIEGRVLANSPRIEDIDEFSNSFKGNSAVWFTGQLIPQGTHFL